MRADAMKWASKHMTARDAVLMIMVSDVEASHNITGATMAQGRSLKSLKTYNPKITQTTMDRLIEEGLVERVGFNYRLKRGSKSSHCEKKSSHCEKISREKSHYNVYQYSMVG